MSALAADPYSSANTARAKPASTCALTTIEPACSSEAHYKKGSVRGASRC